MKDILVIFRKELRETLRDRRTVVLMILLPMLIFPVIIGVVTKVTSSQMEKAQQKILKVALVGEIERRDLFLQKLNDGGKVTVLADVPADSVEARIQGGTLDAAFVFADDFDAQVNGMTAGTLRIYFKSGGNTRIIKRRLMKAADDFEKSLLGRRFKALSIDKATLDAVNIIEIDVASFQEKLGSQVGGFLPYIFIIFCFLGAMYPAIDLAAGEKERGTLETLLTSPVNRIYIVLGKFGVVVLAGVVAAIASIVGLYVGINTIFDLPADIQNVVGSLLQPQTLLSLLTLLLLLTMFFAGIMLSVSIYTRSFKEAQSALTPLNFLVILPAVIGTIPGITLDSVTALVPILNVALATKGVVSGNVDPLLMLEVYGSLIVLAVASVLFCSRWFLREDVLFRS